MPPYSLALEHTIGVEGGIPPRTNGATVINITQAPYNADNTGATSCNAAILAAVTAATSNTVIYFPAGMYKTTTEWVMRKSGVTIRGDYGMTTNYNTNTQIFTFGAAEATASTAATISSGATRGSSNIVLAVGTTAVVGDIIAVQQINTTNSDHQVISSFAFQNIQKEVVRITALASANTSVTFWPPLFMSYTNVPTVVKMSRGDNGVGFVPIQMSGIENMCFASALNGQFNNPFLGYQARIVNSKNCWVRQSKFAEQINFGLGIEVCVNIDAGGNVFQQQNGALPTSNKAGLILGHVKGLAAYNNLYHNRLFPGLQIDAGVSGNWFGFSQCTNNWSDILLHGAHAMYNVFEGINANVLVIADGYFGSNSRQTFFKCSGNIGGFPVIVPKRFSTQFQFIGCNLGTNYAWLGFNYGTNNGNFAYEYQGGFPNIGNNGYVDNKFIPPISYNYPDTFYQTTSANNNGYTFPGPQSGSTLTGDFAFFTDLVAGRFWLQKAANTNMYFSGDDGTVAQAVAPGNGSSITLNTIVTVATGDTAWMVGPASFQGLSLSAAESHLFHGNFDYSSLTVTNNPSYDATLPTSIVFSNTAPYWYYRTNISNPTEYVSRFPAIQANSAGTNYADKVTLMPVQIWFSDGTEPFMQQSSTPPIVTTGGMKINGRTILNGKTVFR
jgi:hypothetical protein